MKCKAVVLFMVLAAGKNSWAQPSADAILYINTYKALAMSEMQRSGIPASIILAQGIHETEAGTSELVRRSNNHFGIKCKDEWKGEVVYHDDDSRGECFRSYPTAEDSYRDHSDFLRRSSRYAFLFDLDPVDYEKWAYGLRKAGYATNIHYSQILVKIIRDYNLQQYSLIAMGKMKASEEIVLTAPGVTPVTAMVPHGETGASSVFLGALKQDSVQLQPQPSYPQGEFTINKTRVIFAQAGVSMLSVADQYELPLSRLLDFNDLKGEDVLAGDQLLFLERKRRTGAVTYHIVREGESLYTICQSEGVRLQDLLEMNLLNAGLQPAAGEKIYLQSTAPSRPRLVGAGDMRRTDQSMN
jgi:hypothetical protein